MVRLGIGPWKTLGTSDELEKIYDPKLAEPKNVTSKGGSETHLNLDVFKAFCPLLM